jgi:hypothetical protein
LLRVIKGIDNYRHLVYILFMTAKAPTKVRVTPLFSFPLDPDLKVQLDAVRDRVGIPVAYQIREGIKMYLATQPAAAKVPKVQKSAEKPSGRKR